MNNTIKAHGAVYTNPEIVELMLDLIGYIPKRSLAHNRLLDPSFGEGVFLEYALKRLIPSYLKKGDMDSIISDLKDSICGIELNSVTYHVGIVRLQKVLEELSIPKHIAECLLDNWLINTDFLLWENECRFDFVIGNPPYVRQELIQDDLLKKYRAVFSTIYDRADLYVPFFEKGLRLLSSEGILCYISADRFTKNRYGKKLREFISDNYKLKYIVDLHKTSPFDKEVSAYPGIYVISANTEERWSVRATSINEVNKSTCSQALKFLRYGDCSDASCPGIKTFSFNQWFEGDSPWVIESEEYRTILQKIEEFKPLENEAHGIKVGIGVASGADKIYIVDPKKIDIESEVLMPLVTTDDIREGLIKWTGRYIINPFREDGSLIDLNQHPKLEYYFNLHKNKMLERNVAKKSNPAKWYKTIDRIYPSLQFKQKLLIPDIKGINHIVKDNGKYYPHHNLYYLLPGNWDIDVLRSVLMSSIVKFFIWSYSVKMRGDFLRYQAQYLRKICLPEFNDLSEQQIISLQKEGIIQNQDELDQIVAEIFGLNHEELALIQGAVRGAEVN